MTCLRIRVRGASRTASVPAGFLDVRASSAPIKDDRGTLVVHWAAPNEEAMVLKVYGHMGVGNWVRKQVVGYRAHREFAALARLGAAGVACADPVFWGTGYSDERGLFEVVAMRELPHAVPLSKAVSDMAHERRAELIERMFEYLATMHAVGTFHGVPFLTNVLLAGAGSAEGSPYWMDFERSIDFACDIRGSSMADYDLHCAASSTVAHCGPKYARAGLERYGLAERDVRSVLAGVRGARSSKTRRYRMRAGFLARGVWSRARVRWAGLRQGGEGTVAPSRTQTGM